MGKIPLVIFDKKKNNLEKIESIVKDIPEVSISIKSTNLDDLEMLLEEKARNIILLGPEFTLQDIEKLLLKYNSALRDIKVILLVKKTSTALLKKAIMLK